MGFKKKVSHDLAHFTRNDMDTKTITLFPYFYSCSSLLFYDSTRVDGRTKIYKDNGSIMTEPCDATRRQQRKGVGSVMLWGARGHKGTGRN